MEVLVYSSLFLVILGVIYAVLHLSLRYYQYSRDAIETQEEAMKGINRLAGELKNAAEVSVKVDSIGVAFLSAETDTGVFEHESGDVVWRKIVGYYTDNNTLIRKEKGLSSPTTDPTSVAMPTPTDIKNDASYSSRVVARGVTTLTCTGDGKITLQAEGEDTLSQGGTAVARNQVTVTTQVDFSQ